MPSEPAQQPRAVMHRRHEEEVLAESSRVGEQVVAGIRVAVLLCEIALFAPLEAGAHRSVFRAVVVAAYLLFAVGAFVRLRWGGRTNRKLALWMPLLANVFDFGFIFTMALATGHANRPDDVARAAIAVGLVLCYSVARFRLLHVGISTGIACICYGVISLWAGSSLVTTLFVLVGLLALGTLIGWTNAQIRKSFVDLRRRDHLTRLLPPRVVQRVLALGDEALAPVQRDVTVMFLDVRGFTSLSESMAPRAVLELLESLFAPVCAVVGSHGGVVNKFLGDGMLAMWGVPDSDPEHARRAVEAAMEIRAVMVELNDRRREQDLAPIGIGMGIHSGPVAAGMLGSLEQREYTVIGDAVNVASRVEGLTKAFAVDALISEATWVQLPPELRGERLGARRVKGRHELVVVFALPDPERAERTQPFLVSV